MLAIRVKRYMRQALADVEVLIINPSNVIFYGNKYYYQEPGDREPREIISFEQVKIEFEGDKG